MKVFWIVVGTLLTFLLTSCAMGQPAMPLPTATGTLVLVSATPTALPTATFTAVPPTSTSTAMPTPTSTSTLTPTSTSTATPTATATATTRPSPTPTLPPFLLTNDTPPLPFGKGGLIIVNHFGSELNYDIGGKVYQIPANSRMAIFLSPGRYNFSASAINFAGRAGSTEVVDGYYRQQDWG